MSTDRAHTVFVTGTGLAVPGLSGAADLLGTAPAEGGFDPETGLTGRDLRHKDRATRLALRAVGPALEDAGLHDADDGFTADPAATAVVVSSNTGNYDSVCGYVDTAALRGSRALSATGLPQTSTSGIVGWIAINYGLRGPTVGLGNGPAGGLDALHWGRNLIAVGRAGIAVVVGVEPHNDVVARLLGTTAVDGAAAVVLESAEHAARRGARPRAVLRGYGRAPGLDGAVRRAAADGPDGAGLLLVDRLPDEPPGTGRVLDLQARLGHCSGALGVLQCAAATAWFDRGGRGPALATAEGTDASVALLLAPPDAS
ncbi:beta-ketoacyl synthase N-terminal-like domain-containing protein [Streptomyces luteireticuli]|uniref:beta-ketoacyl synthase N-terminal-like domain-containing protein n=1 Tax=Streptomyces luteireticuli TaxID=173858 RepID=UPI0035567FEF